MKHKGIRKVCNRGHVFYKSSDCPICPMCWSGYYRQRLTNDLPNSLSAPALRALLNAKITNLRTLSRWSQHNVADLHGMGPGGIAILRRALKQKKLSFKK